MENDEWREALAPEIHKHDLFFCRYSYLVNVLADVDRRTILIDADDIEYVRLWRKATSWTSGWKSALLALEALKARRYERSLVSQSLKVFVCSEPDKVKLGSQNVSVIRNGVDLAAELDDEIIRRPATMLFLGAMTHEPNLTGLKWFCEEVWPKVIDTVPQASLRIAGYGMSQVDMSFAEQAGIELLGEIDEPSVELQGTQISIVPVLFGTGTRVKIAESLGYGCTVVSTTIGAEGYDDFDEHHGLYRVDESDKMVRVLCELLNDRLNCEAAGLRGRELALQRLDWRFVTAPTLSVIEQRADTVQQAL
ncbi:MAG: glycosyltransferase [Pseudomonadota bacterium]